LILISPQVLILGTFHMSEQENLNSHQRQKEIEEVVNRLISFKPSKVAVEMITDKNEELNQKFNNYKSNTYELEMNEIYQLGFRIAKKLNHNQIYAIDWMGLMKMKRISVKSIIGQMKNNL
jgi:hypothetical protein